MMRKTGNAAPFFDVRCPVKKILLDTNLYIDWLNRGLHETVSRRAERTFPGFLYQRHSHRSDSPIDRSHSGDRQRGRLRCDPAG